MIGGMEKVHYILSQELKKKVPTDIIALKKSQKFLPIFIITSFFKVIYLSNKHNVTNIHIGDGLLAPLGCILKVLLNKKVTITIHGLDITYKNYFYQVIIPKCVNKLDKVICISNAALHECAFRNIDRGKCVVVLLGIYPSEFYEKSDRNIIEGLIQREVTENQKILITVGRLVPRKGVNWFIENVFVRLKNDYLYLVVGKGQDKEKIIETINRHKLNEKIFILSGIEDKILKKIYSTSDLFIMPNIKVEGDMEGFGMVLIEAGSAGLYSVASNMEGITDAIINNVTGSLVQPQNVSEFIKSIEENKDYDREKIMNAINKEYSWERTVSQYITIFKMK